MPSIDSIMNNLFKFSKLDMRENRCLIIVLLLITLSQIMYAQDAKLHLRDFLPRFAITSFKVYGKCGLCTVRILNVLNVMGVKSAYWHKENQELTVQYDDKKINVNQIYLLLAAVGHDSDKMKAKKKVYESLPFCCHYRNSNLLNNQ